MNVKLGCNPSFIWRSLLCRRDLLDIGLCWRIGDGSSVDIFEDRWISSLGSKLDPQTVSLPIGTKVSSLILNRCWNETLIRSVFLPYVAMKILSIHLSPSFVGNSRFWSFIPKGKFTVSSGYGIGMGMHESHIHQSNTSYVHNWWTVLWSLPIPPNIKVFWWKLFHNIIPTGSNLQKHHVSVSSWCSFCFTSEDSTCHALFFCSAVKHIWKDNFIWKKIKHQRNCSAIDLCFWLLKHTSRIELAEFFYHAWLVWKERCWALHKSENRSLRIHLFNVPGLLQ